MGIKDTTIKISIPKGYKPSARRAIAQDVVDFIVNRSHRGLDKKNKPFAKYSKEYTKSLDFKNAGKSKHVNLKLSGDMLAELEVLKHKSGEIKIGYEADSSEREKAEGNILGTYGQSSPVSGKKRDFLGLREVDLQRIMKKYPLEDKAKLQREIAESLAAQQLAEEFVDGDSIKIK